VKSITPRQLAFYIALIASLIVSVSVYVIVKVYLHMVWWQVVAGGLVSFFMIYYVVLNMLRKLIIERINPIYKTIHNVNISQKELKKSFENSDVFTEVKSDVIKWAQKRKNEIAELRQMEKYRKEFLGNVMHELKTPIFNIQGYVLTLIDGGLDDPTINKLYLERTEKSINRLISIVEDLESISRLESGELKLEIGKFDIRKLIEESFEIHEMLAKNMSIKLKFDKIYDKPIYVHADRNRLLEAVNNLVVNSIKYGRNDGLTTVSFHDMDENILVEITDNGIGIEESKIPRVFERFFRVDKGRSREQGGTGLGLSIVKHIIEAHNQTINVRSRVNEGSAFAFTLSKVLGKDK
jgi:two-component system, OmpR family, phosphate regulon sensor histidine kinase PhoR